MASRAARAGAIAFLQHLAQLRMGGLQGGGKTEEQTSRQRNPAGEKENRPVDPNLIEPRQILRLKCDEQIDSPEGEKTT